VGWLICLFVLRLVVICGLCLVIGSFGLPRTFTAWTPRLPLYLAPPFAFTVCRGCTCLCRCYHYYTVTITFVDCYGYPLRYVGDFVGDVGLRWLPLFPRLIWAPVGWFVWLRLDVGYVQLRYGCCPVDALRLFPTGYGYVVTLLIYVTVRLIC